MTEQGHDDPFPRPDPNGRCRFGQETFAGVRGNGRDAPKAALLGALTMPPFRSNPDRVSPLEGPESERRKLPQSVKFGHRGLANKAVPAGWIRRIVDARFAMQ